MHNSFRSSFSEEVSTPRSSNSASSPFPPLWRRYVAPENAQGVFHDTNQHNINKFDCDIEDVISLDESALEQMKIKTSGHNMTAAVIGLQVDLLVI